MSDSEAHSSEHGTSRSDPPAQSQRGGPDRGDSAATQIARPGLYLSRSELARLAAVHPETIRFYERAGLLAPPPRSAAGHRQFPAAAVQQLQVIKMLRRLGFSLREARQLLEVRQGSAPIASELERRLADLEHRLDELRHVLAAAAHR